MRPRVRRAPCVADANSGTATFSFGIFGPSRCVHTYCSRKFAHPFDVSCMKGLPLHATRTGGQARPAGAVPRYLNISRSIYAPMCIRAWPPVYIRVSWSAKPLMQHHATQGYMLWAVCLDTASGVCGTSGVVRSFDSLLRILVDKNIAMPGGMIWCCRSAMQRPEPLKFVNATRLMGLLRPASCRCSCSCQCSGAVVVPPTLRPYA